MGIATLNEAPPSDVVLYIPVSINQPPQPPPAPAAGTPVAGTIVKLNALDPSSARIQLSPTDFAKFSNGDVVLFAGTGTAADGKYSTLTNANSKSNTFACLVAIMRTAFVGTITKQT